jgi:hypothetical protein
MHRWLFANTRTYISIVDTGTKTVPVFLWYNKNKVSYELVNTRKGHKWGMIVGNCMGL